MEKSPVPVDPLALLAELSIEATPFKASQLQARHGNAVYRLASPDVSYILKYFGESAAATEIKSYELLGEYGVPTPRLIAQGERTLLLEDLAYSLHWRLATAADLASPQVAQGIAAWYKKLHAAGRRLLRDAPTRAATLPREYATLTPEGILAIGDKLGLSRLPLWRKAASHIVNLQKAVDSQALTLTYNDFYWTNLSVSREAPVEAVMFDYHLLGCGMVYSDYRNVMSALSHEAKEAFAAAFGPVNEDEQTLDEALADFYALLVAVERPILPSWAQGVIERVRSGRLEQSLTAALALLAP